MERFVKGEIVVLKFPYSNLEGYKKRPAIIISSLRGDDIILSQITSSKKRNDEYAIELNNIDFETGNLPKNNSLIRTNVLFTANKSLISKKVGKVNNKIINKLQEKLISIIEC